ncbi:hypothetical protein Hte_012579 [Hypoxylon texense]
MALSNLTISIVVIVVVTFVIYHIGFLNQRRPADNATYIQQQRAIANFGVLGQHDLDSRLRARAIPNQRLRSTFGIVSSFTTEDRTIHHEFLQRARADISKMGPEHCVEFFHAAQLALDRAVAHVCPPGQRVIYLARVVRTFVLITTLTKFFHINPSSIDVEAAALASEAINRLWIQSKTSVQAGRSNDQELLHYALGRLLPGRFPCEPKDHPLNIIMPAYETMWRVVLLTFIAAGFRSQDETASQQFRKVVERIPECFNGGDRLYEQVALDYAKEGLRLYPPTRRIYRAVPGPLRGRDEIQSADVEYCHRDRSTWGPDALQFRPSRWRAVSADMRRAYLPFGDGRHVCPAAGGFGYRAVVMFVAAMARRLGTRGSGARVDFGKRDAELQSRPDAPLPYGRQELEDWVLLRD